MISSTGDEILIIVSRPLTAIASEITEKSAIHFALLTDGTRFEKYSPHDESSPVQVLKQARMKIAAMKYLPHCGHKVAAAAESMSSCYGTFFSDTLSLHSGFFDVYC